MGQIFVRASRRARAHTRSSIARRNKLNGLIGKVGRKLASVDTRSGRGMRRHTQLSTLHNKLRAKSFEQTVIVAAKKQKGSRKLGIADLKFYKARKASNRATKIQATRLRAFARRY